MPQANRYESAAEVAQHIRQALKVTFPGVKFSVTSKTYSGGDSVRVTWTDGPTTERVKPITEQHQNVRYDGGGEILSGGNRFVFVDRGVSPELERKALAIAHDRYGIREVVAADLLDWDERRRYSDVLAELDAYTPPTTPQVKRTASPKKDKPAPAAVDAPSYHVTGIAAWLTFPAEAPADVVALLNGAGWHYSRKRDAWYNEGRTSPPAGVVYVAK